LETHWQIFTLQRRANGDSFRAMKVLDNAISGLDSGLVAGTHIFC
jgi:hypothetical protein